MTDAEFQPEEVPLQPEVKFERQRRLPGLALSVVLAGVGGFLGGVISSYGPTYLEVYVAQPMLANPLFDQTVFDANAPEVSVAEDIEGVETQDIALEPAGPTGAAARLVIHSGKRAYLVIASRPETHWGIGQKRVSGKEFLATTTQAVSPETAPAELFAWTGREVALYDNKGYSCTAKVGELLLLQQAATDDIHDSASDWDEYGDFGPLLVAPLESIRNSCKSATWGRDLALPAPALGRVIKPGAKLKREATRAFRTTSTWKQIQSEFKAEGGAGRWDQRWEQSLVIESIKGPSEQLVFVGTEVGGCGEFGANLGVLFRRDADGGLTPLPKDSSVMLGIQSAADFDGDGDLDFITRGDAFDRSLVFQDDALRVDTHSAVGIHYCRC